MTRLIRLPILAVGSPCVYLYSLGDVLGMGDRDAPTYALVRHINYDRGLIAISKLSSNRDRWWRLRRLWRRLFPVCWVWPDVITQPQ